ncbi:hypothetical protein A2Z53_00635 [Candidatus Giovannonibacteria bacterium RIFCSPHIGHO2_02_42_15]|uniref:AMP-dependent synthetase/ligase domain-containing protein n=2 Tax=Candidatus Giovannoniibacteriota TaxID=1752738 RepID=A0A1F5VLU7_9BACT|nr:MAG: Coenzyme F390 synthetase [Candidatus Giovannonibacteria bacterium GW2011_GWF2_42_19]OGF64397.1 MAG: hypothetical protein A2Z53_00635 [Candidatus Giovannonibacteria bacterium RIFCSPHIGHO2_02_42_15]
MSNAISGEKSVILVPQNLMEKKKEELKQFLTEIKELDFWKSYSEHKNFIIDPEKFSLEYWQSLPLSSKEDFIKMGLKERIRDAFKINTPDVIFNLILRATSGTIGSTNPVLFLNPVINSSNVFDKMKEDSVRVLTMQRSYMMGLRSALLNIIKCMRKKAAFETLIVNPGLGGISSALKEYSADMIVGLPQSFAKLAAEFYDRREIIKNVKKIKMNGDFLNKDHASLITDFFSGVKDLDMGIDYAMTEFGKVGTWCKYLAKRYHGNAYHPGRFFLAEIVDADPDGYGEIIVTKIIPRQLSLLRYCTGDIGKGIFETCECGAGVTLFLIGRKNFDYIKCAGALVVRKEIERAISIAAEDIEEWRGEVREHVRGREIVGELVLKLKFESGHGGYNEMVSIGDRISENLFLTPAETLKDLVDKKKFFPLKIELIKKFPDSPKKIMLRKII